MKITEVKSIAQNRLNERMQASQDAQDGLIEYVACMADIELPEEEVDNEQMVQDSEE